MELNRNEKRKMIQDSIITSGEAVELLQVSRTRLHQYVKEGRIEPILNGIYLKDDIIHFRDNFKDGRFK